MKPERCPYCGRLCALEFVIRVGAHCWYCGQGRPEDPPQEHSGLCESETFPYGEDG